MRRWKKKEGGGKGVAIGEKLKRKKENKSRGNGTERRNEWRKYRP